MKKSAMKKSALTFFCLCITASTLLTGGAQAQFMPERARLFTTDSTSQTLYEGERVWLTVCSNFREFTIIFGLTAKRSETIKLEAGKALDWPGNCVTRIAQKLILQGSVSPEAKGWYAFEQVSRPAR